jgi:Helix-turn-helix domain
MSITLTVPQIAEILKTDQKKVGKLIKSGELVAINIAHNPRGVRPRWRVLQSEFERFLAARQTQPPAPKTTRKRKAEGVIEYFK